MNLSHNNWLRHSWLVLLPALMFFLNGCATEDTVDTGASTQVDVAHLHVGDTLTVTYEGPPDPIPAHQESIKDNGTITLDSIGPIQAAGLTLGQLQQNIYNAYVPKYYPHLTVTVVNTSDRVYYVRGEVGHPGEEIYRGDSLTVTQAIAAAGDFNDFANRSKVLLIRANGTRIKVDCEKVLNNDEVDPPVYPGDQIIVKRRLL